MREKYRAEEQTRHEMFDLLHLGNRLSVAVVRHVIGPKAVWIRQTAGKRRERTV